MADRVYAIAGFVLCVLFYLFVGEPEEKAAGLGHSGKTEGAWKRLLTSKGWLWNLIIVIFVMVSFWSVTVFLPIFLTKVKGMNIAVAGGIAGLTGLAGLFGMWVTGWFSDHRCCSCYCPGGNIAA